MTGSAARLRRGNAVAKALVQQQGSGLFATIHAGHPAWRFAPTRGVA